MALAHRAMAKAAAKPGRGTEARRSGLGSRTPPKTSMDLPNRDWGLP